MIVPIYMDIFYVNVSKRKEISQAVINEVIFHDK
jgi:hypothetical protein